MKKRGTVGDAVNVLLRSRTVPRGREPKSGRKPGQFGAKLDQRRKDKFREKQVTAAASKLTPEEARKALAIWAASGGKIMHDGGGK